MSESQPRASRRGFMWGAAAVGAATAAAVTLPRTDAPETQAADQVPKAPEKGGGYRVTEHVKRYYRSTLV